MWTHFLNLSVLVAQSCPTLFDPMDYIACQAPLSIGFSRQEFWSGLPFLSPRDLPIPGFLHYRCILLPFGPPGKPRSQCITWKVKVSLSDSLRPHGLYSPRNSQGQNTGVGSLSRDFPNPGIKPRSPELQADSLPLSHKGSPMYQIINTYLLLTVYV